MNIFQDYQQSPVVLAKQIEMDTASSLSHLPYAISCNAFPRSDMFNVLSYSPQAGQVGSTVTIDILFNNTHWCNDVHIRIVIGDRAIHTEIKSIGGNVPNLWRCTGPVPSLKDSSVHTVDISIQAVNKCNKILDAITFGRFIYQGHGKHRSFLFEPIVLRCLSRTLFVRAWRLRCPPQGQHTLIRHGTAYRSPCSTSSRGAEQDFPRSPGEQADPPKP
jgi:hypothetical protein